MSIVWRIDPSTYHVYPDKLDNVAKGETYVTDDLKLEMKGLEEEQQ